MIRARVIAFLLRWQRSFTRYSRGVFGVSVLCILLFGISRPALAQGGYDWRNHADFLVEQIDSLSLKSQRVFILNKIYRKDRPLKETWYYTMKAGKVIFFEVHYVEDTTEYTETYYLSGNRPLCMEQYETVYPSFYEDQIVKAKVGWFVNNSLRQYVTMGYDKDNNPFWDPQSEFLDQFSKRYSELLKNIIVWHGVD